GRIRGSGGAAPRWSCCRSFVAVHGGLDLVVGEPALFQEPRLLRALPPIRRSRIAETPLAFACGEREPVGAAVDRVARERLVDAAAPQLGRDLHRAVAARDARTH